VNDGQLRRRLADSCPWWTRPAAWQRDDPDLRAVDDAPFTYEPAPLRDIAPPGLYMLRGPRRVGKSVELKRTIARLLAAGVNPRAIFFIACDGLNPQDLRRIVTIGLRDIPRIEGPRYWLLDEVTAVARWPVVIKELRDQNTAFREGCVVLTGSSARNLREATSNLADRRGGVADSDRLLLPMGFRQFCAAVGDVHDIPPAVLRPRDFLTERAASALHDLHPWWAELDDRWQLFLRVGGFPRAVGDFVRDGVVGQGFLNGMADLIGGDAFSTTAMSEVQVNALLERLVRSLGTPVNASRLARDVGLPDNEAVEIRIGSLVLAFLAWRCHRLKNGLPNPMAQRKVYFADPLIARLAHLRDARYPDPDPSVLSEQQIGLALTRAVAPDAPGAFVESSEVMYDQSASRSEIDFAGPRLAVPFESKYVDGSWRRGAQAMRARYGRGVMVTRSAFGIERGDPPLWAVPAGMVAWAIDGSTS
jgi:hypothetical protein